MISSTDLPADHPGLLPGRGCYPGIMRNKHSLHQQQPHHTTPHHTTPQCGARIPSGLDWPDNFESEAVDHYKSNRHSLDWKPGWNAVLEYVDIREEEEQWGKVVFIPAGVHCCEAADWLEPDYPVIEFVMRTPPQLFSPSRPWSNDTLSPDPAS